MTRRLFVLFAVLAAAVALYVVPAQAATLTITSDDVGWIQQNQPNGTHCGSFTYANGSGTQGRKASFQFPMAALPAGSTITAATLRVYAASNTNSSAVLTAYDRNVTAFDGCSITWNNFPALGAQLGVSTAGVNKNQYKSIPLTTNLADIATTGRMAITVTTQVSTDLKFQSYIGVNPPKLDITYTPAATTTTSSTTTTTIPPSTTCGAVTSPPEYGAGSVGPGNEDRDTTGTQATTSNYTTVLAAANSGDEVLLRAGTTYGNLNIPAGVTVKPYDCEPVTASSFDLQNGSTIAGFTVSSTSAQWLDRIDGRTTAITDVEIRNMTLRGGTTEAIRIEDDVDGVLITGSDIDGGQNNHAIKVMDANFTGNFPRNVTITNSTVKKEFFASPGEDAVQLEGTSSPVVLSHLSFPGLTGEEFIDVKSPSAGVTINNNLLDSRSGNGSGQGTNWTPGGGCALLTSDMAPLFFHNKVIDDCFLEVGGYGINTNPVIDQNIIDDTEVVIRSSNGAVLKRNIQTRGILDLGTSNPGDVPTNLVIGGTGVGNTFKGPMTLKVEPASGYSCTGNTWDTSAGSFTQEGTLTCTSNPVP